MLIDLKDPTLGKQLIDNAKGDLPLEVFRKYFFQHSDILLPVLDWLLFPTPRSRGRTPLSWRILRTSPLSIHKKPSIKHRH
jgi:hypothetical protein